MSGNDENAVQQTDGTRCAAVEESLSAFLDGELTAGAAAEALEHAFACASCRRFFLAAKRLQALAPELAEPAAAGAASATAAPDPVWERIRAASGLAGAARRRWPAVGIGPRLRAAALVALGLGAGYALAPFARGPLPAGAPPSSGAVAAVAAADVRGEAMDERRFVALAEELLAADPKFQRTMLQVLRLVPALETGEGLREEEVPGEREPSDEPESRGFVRARAEEERRPRGSV